MPLDRHEVALEYAIALKRFARPPSMASVGMFRRFFGTGSSMRASIDKFATSFTKAERKPGLAVSAKQLSNFATQHADLMKLGAAIVGMAMFATHRYGQLELAEKDMDIKIEKARRAMIESETRELKNLINFTFNGDIDAMLAQRDALLRKLEERQNKAE